METHELVHVRCRMGCFDCFVCLAGKGGGVSFVVSPAGRRDLCLLLVYITCWTNNKLVVVLHVHVHVGYIVHAYIGHMLILTWTYSCTAYLTACFFLVSKAVGKLIFVCFVKLKYISIIIRSLS